MFTPVSRIILLLVCAGLSVVAAIFNLVTILVITSILSFMLLYGYFRKGSVMLALKQLKKEDYKEAERVVDQNSHPDRLDKKDRAYYLFVKGFVAREKDQFEEAKIYLEEALQGGIKNQNDIAMAILALSDMEMVKHNRTAAKEYFIQIKDLKVKPELMPAVRKMQEWLGV
jgi:tetratricopeptide (TPR) repeat protein